MKLFWFTAMLVSATISTGIAQTGRGNGLISGGLSLDYGRTDSPSLTDPSTNSRVGATVDIRAGYFFRDNWLVGAGLSVASVTYITETTNYTRRSTSTLATISPFVRHYWPVGPVQVFAGAGISIGINHGDDSVTPSATTVNTNSDNSSSVLPVFEVGANYFLTKRLSVQASASASSLPLGVGTVRAGLVYWLGKGSNASQPTGTANPQTDRGRRVIEGSLSSYASANNNDNLSALRSTGSSVSVNLSVGYFVKKNTLIGLGFPLSFGSQTYTGGNNPNRDTRSQTLGISAYGQHYWTNNRLTPFSRAEVAFQRSGNAVNGGGISYNASTVVLSASVGLAYMLGERFIIETSLAGLSLNRTATYNGLDVATNWYARLTGQSDNGFRLRFVF